MRISRRTTLILLLAVLLLGGVAWAVLTLFRVPDAPESAPEYALVEVVPGEVSETLQLNVAAAWAATPIGTNRASGTVTGVAVAAGDEVSQGTVLYTVNLRPVVVAQGEVPAFRDIAAGVSGEDVRQAQQMLADLGYFAGDISGEAGALTAAAIREWQASLGAEETGVIALGDIIFVPTLPIRVALDQDIIARGATLLGGEPAILGLAASPEFTIPVTAAQAARIPEGSKVEMTSPAGNTWLGVTGEQKREEADGTVVIAVHGLEGAEICGSACAELPAFDGRTLLASVHIRETVAGLVVPSSALYSEADGTVILVDERGTRRAIEVVAAARGMSVVEGVEAGTRVRVPGLPSQ